MHTHVKKHNRDTKSEGIKAERSEGTSTNYLALDTLQFKAMAIQQSWRHLLPKRMTTEFKEA